MCVTSFDNNRKISKVRGICQVGCKRVYLVPELHVVTNYMIEILVENVKVLLMYFPQNINQEF